jgi:hypothetical protein
MAVRQRPGCADRRVETDAGITGSARSIRPTGREGRHRRTVLPHHRLRPRPTRPRRGPVRDREDLAQDVPRQHLWRPPRRRASRHERHRHRAVGHQGQGARAAGLETARRRLPPADPLLRELAVRTHAGEDRRTGRRYRDQGFSAVKFGWDPMGQDERDRPRPGARSAPGPGRRRRSDDRRRPGLGRQDRPPAGATTSPSTTSSGSRNRCGPTITRATASSSESPRPCASPPARRKAAGSRSSN